MIRSPIGSKIYIGTQTAASTIAEFEADTWVEVSPVESIGTFGESSEIIKFVPLGDGIARKVAGAHDAGELELSLAYVPDDPGQVALLAAYDGNTGDPFNFKVEFNDALKTGVGPHHGTRAYFKAIVAEKAFDAVSSKDLVKLKSKLAITTAVTMSAAA